MTKRRPKVPVSLLQGNAARVAFQGRMKRDLRGLTALIEHYGINERAAGEPAQVAYFLLALELARDFVPFFREATNPGPEPLWNGTRLMRLYCDVQALRPSARSIDKALVALVDSGQYRNSTSKNGQYSVEYLKEKYDAARVYLGPEVCAALKKVSASGGG